MYSIKGIMSSLIILVLSTVSYGAGVQSADLNTIDLDSNPVVVTNVSLEGLATSEDLANSTSTNNELFVDAVTNSPIHVESSGSGSSGDFPVSDWSKYGTIGALLAALVASVIWLRSKAADADSEISLRAKKTKMLIEYYGEDGSHGVRSFIGSQDGGNLYTPARDYFLTEGIGGTVSLVKSGGSLIRIASTQGSFSSSTLEFSVPDGGDGMSYGFPSGRLILERFLRPGGFVAYSSDGTVPSAYTSTPEMDGAGSAGNSSEWARGNHVHPSDTSKANAADVSNALNLKADATDLPYRLVEPGKWEFSDGGSYTMDGPYEAIYGEPSAGYFWKLFQGPTELDSSVSYESASVMSVEFPVAQITATRASLPGHLCDRAGNRVVVSGDTTLTLPAANPGYLRDFLVRLEISGSTVPTITFQGQGSEAPNGADEITYETDGDEFPVPDEAGNWVYSFTENCVAHKFAVSLKKVNEVAAPQAQGGA